MAVWRKRFNRSISEFSAYPRKKLIGISVVVVVVMMCIVIGASVGASRRRASLNKNKNASMFERNFIATWAADHLKLRDGGQIVDVILDQTSGAGFGSYNRYLYGNLGMHIKLVPNDSAGTVTTYYLSSLTDDKDQLEYQFIGNASGQPYVLQTNIYVNGLGDREQRMFLWFDPTTEYHEYKILWNQYQIVFFVDDLPIRVFRNNSAAGLPYPHKQPVGIYSSLWNGAQWAGLQKINWAYAPFTASYQGFTIDGCQIQGSVDDCLTGTYWWDSENFQKLDANQTAHLKWVQERCVIYNYCTDAQRFSSPPPECAYNP
ncbi:hypothetical protein O6H91_01G015800 [Diphasiastrum complanatum]|uniref:Uncharacterized protein n=1 Tax=Diphasiastrum complanatum TaxID=34168 RepID=A0ACC2ENG6_DIPCM|nr:hypothetical protein O6H91_01G015800 [Diphasiastrum complanatum]